MSEELGATPKISPSSNRLENISSLLQKNSAIILAVPIIVAFLIFYGAVLIYDKDKEYVGLEKVTSTIGPIVAAIIGYYFGQRHTQTIAESAEEARNSYAKSKQEDISNIEDLKNKTEDFLTQVQSLKDTSVPIAPESHLMSQPELSEEARKKEELKKKIEEIENTAKQNLFALEKVRQKKLHAQ